MGDIINTALFRPYNALAVGALILFWTAMFWALHSTLKSASE